MTSVLPLRRRCPCGRTLARHANGTIPRHTAMLKGAVRKRCVYVGQLFPAIARERGRPVVPVAEGAPVGRSRGGRREAKRDTKGLFRRNAAGGYNGRPGSAGSNMTKVG